MVELDYCVSDESMINLNDQQKTDYCVSVNLALHNEWPAWQTTVNRCPSVASVKISFSDGEEPDENVSMARALSLAATEWTTGGWHLI